MCIEKYLVTCYPDKDWTAVAKRCWQWTSIYWDEGCDIYAPIVPEFLLEFDNYSDANTYAFDGKLSKKDYLELRQLYKDITNGSAEDEINQVLMLPINFNNECECTDFKDADDPTLMIVHKMQEILALHNIYAPDINTVKNMTVDIKGGWGNFVNSEYLSIIINP